MSLRKVGLLGDSSTHGGTIISSNQDGTVIVENKQQCVSGALHSCPLEGHGITAITGNLSVKTRVNGKLLVLHGSTAGCGASIISSAIKTRST